MLSAEDITKTFKKLGRSIHSKEIEDILNMLGNKNHVITFEAFKGMMLGTQP